MITAKEFVKLCRKGELKGCYLFFGPEEYAKKETLGALRRTLFEEGDDSFNHTVINAADDGDFLVTLAEQIRMLPVFAEKKLVEVHSFHFMKASSADVECLEAVADELRDHEECLVVLYAENDEFEYFKSYKKPSERAKELSEHMELVCFDVLTRAELVDRVGRRAVAAGLKIDAATAGEVVDYCSSDLCFLTNETEKLIGYTLASGRDTVDRNDIEKVCCGRRVYGVFDFTDALMRNDAVTAFRILSRMKARKTPPEEILSGVIDLLSNMLTVRVLLDGGSSIADVMRQTGMKEYPVKKYASAVRTKRAERLKRAMSICLDADLQIKTAPINKYTVVDKLVLRMCRV